MSFPLKKWAAAALLASFAAGCVSPTSSAPHLGQTASQRTGAVRSVDDQLVQGRLQEHEGKFESAAKTYKAILKTEPTYAAAHHRLGVLAARDGRYEDAERHFIKALDCGGSSSDLLADLGYNYFLQGRLSDAEQSLREAVAKNPQNRRANNNLGVVYGHQGKFEASLAQFQRAVGGAKARQNLARIRAEVGPIDAAAPETQSLMADDRSASPHERRHQQDESAPRHSDARIDDELIRDSIELAGHPVLPEDDHGWNEPAVEPIAIHPTARLTRPAAAIFPAPKGSAFSTLPPHDSLESAEAQPTARGDREFVAVSAPAASHKSASREGEPARALIRPKRSAEVAANTVQVSAELELASAPPPEQISDTRPVDRNRDSGEPATDDSALPVGSAPSADPIETEQVAKAPPPRRGLIRPKRPAIKLGGHEL